MTALREPEPADVHRRPVAHLERVRWKHWSDERVADQESIPRDRVERPNPTGRVIHDQGQGRKLGERGDAKEPAVVGAVGSNDGPPLPVR